MNFSKHFSAILYFVSIIGKKNKYGFIFYNAAESIMCYFRKLFLLEKKNYQIVLVLEEFDRTEKNVVEEKRIEKNILFDSNQDKNTY